VVLIKLISIHGGGVRSVVRCIVCVTLYYHNLRVRLLDLFLSLLTVRGGWMVLGGYCGESDGWSLPII